MADNKVQTYTVGKQILTEDDLECTVEYKGEIFTMRYANPYARSMIEAEIARHLNGMSRDVFTVEHVTTVVACSYISNLLVSEKSPKWFASPWTCLDDELIGNLYAGYLSFRDEIQEKIRGDGFARGSEGNKS